MSKGRPETSGRLNYKGGIELLKGKRAETYPQNLFRELCNQSVLDGLQKENLDKLVQSLPSLQRTAITLRYIRHYTLAECAKELRITVERFKMLLESAMRNLKQPDNVQRLFFGQGCSQKAEAGLKTFACAGKVKGRVIRELNDRDFAEFLHSICPEVSTTRWSVWLQEVS